MSRIHHIHDISITGDNTDKQNMQSKHINEEKDTKEEIILKLYNSYWWYWW